MAVDNTKIALIIPNNLWISPYVRIYTRVLDKKGVKYDVISWNREGRKEECIQYNCQIKSRNPLILLWAYRKYSSFVKKVVNRNRYDRLIVFTPQSAIFLRSFLKKRYEGKYVFDYRDLSLEQKRLFSKSFLKVLSNSYANVISSPGFIKYLPKRFDYILSHNFDADLVQEAINNSFHTMYKEKINVLTIGAIRRDMNVEMIEALGNVENMCLSFVGKGPASQELEDFVKEKGYKNISFTGFYHKEEEASFIKQCNFVNIFYPQTPSHKAALSNRFYNSLIYKRPMLVTKNSTQGDYAEQYNVGLVVENCDDLPRKIKGYLDNLDYCDYCRKCNCLLRQFVKEYKIWELMLLNFLL